MANIHVTSRAALVDRWGRLHRIAATTQIGRVATDASLCVLTPTVSRRHALLMLDDDGAWHTRDLGSSNGTFIDDERVTGEAVLRDRARLRLGRLSFYFIADATGLNVPASARAISRTIRPPSDGETSRSTLEYEAQASKEVAFEFEEPTGGGGAVLRVGEKRVQLTIAQKDLILVLIRRMLDEHDADEEVRGYVPIEDLLARISLDSHDAAEDNVRQLVRRVRRSLEKAGIGELIESRPGRGYRLRVVPKLVS